ncbi:hypothetical protein OUZ56_021483 [Daphnia magna]|uniref:Uncharacterized protein n=1 Tax=Daphnia magna TaxID=35525 RepID=A0ABQ9ZIX7_9CRUS|nr:hypothetical protein OUZ56_021483 [Daphnia magna]
MGKTVDELRLSVSTTILLLVSSAFIGRILYDGRYGLSGVYAALTVSPEKQPSYYYNYNTYIVYKTKASTKKSNIRKSSLWFMPGRVGAMNSPGDGVALGSCRSIVDIRL